MTKLFWRLMMRLSSAIVSPGAPAVSTISTATQTEGTSLVHTVTLASAVASSPAQYPFSIVSGTASTPSDYSATPTFSAGVTLSGGNVTVPVGVTSFTITVATVQDAIYEGSETYSVTVGGITATGTILDDEAVPSVSGVSSSAATEGAIITHTVTIAGQAQAARTYALSITGATATAGGVDFTSALTNASFSGGVTISGSTITVPAGITSFTVAVQTVDDAIVESSETYTLTIGGMSGTGTINDNDTPIGKTFFLNLSNALNSTIADAQGVGNITAAISKRFLLNLTGAVNATIADAQGMGTITASVGRRFFLNLSNPVNTTISDAQGMGTITAAVGGGGGSGEPWSTTYGSVPLATDAVVVSAGTTVRLDGTNVARTLDIQGTLIVPVNMSTSLTVGNITIGANGVMMTEGGATLPPQYTFVLTLNGAEVGRTPRVVSGTTLGFTNDGVGRSLQVNAGGKLNLFGTSPTIKRTKLNASAAAGTNTFTLADSTGWLAGDEIVMGTTDFYGVSVPEKLTLQSNASGTSIQSTTTIASPRWGALQYVTDSGMSLTAGTLTGGAPAGIGTASATPTIVDERAFVINLTRNIVIQGANDTAWTSNKFGAHCMFMGRTSDIKLDGVQFRRVGQAGAIGRYPIHWHMMSYNMPNGMNLPSDGTFVGEVVGAHYAKNCSVSESGQRMIVIHGTWGVTLDANVGFDITGHAIFLEDGSERSNTITNNVVMKVRSPTSANKLLKHDIGSGTADGTGITVKSGTTAYWNTNPANTWQNNWANDCEGTGFWSSFAPAYFGLSVNVPNTTTGPTPNPMYTNLGLIEGTVAMGNNGVGQLTNTIVGDDMGNTYEQSYVPSFLTNPIKNLQLYKNNGGGYSNRVNNPQYQNFIAADNAGQDVFGQATVDSSVMVNTLAVAETLNNANSKVASSYKAAFATYHEYLNFKNCLLVGYVYKAGIQQDGLHSFLGGGIFRLEDLYMQGLFTLSGNTGNKLIGCDVPFRSLPPLYDGAALNNRNWTLAGAIYDKTGIFGIQGKYWIYNLPFLTYGTASPVNVTAGVPSNGVVTTSKFFSIDEFRHTDDYGVSSLAISVDRQDSSGAVVGNWSVGNGYTSVMLGNMRNFAVMAGGRYALNMPGYMANDYIDVTVNCANMESGDMFMLGIPFSGALTPSTVWQQAGNSIRVGYSMNAKVDFATNIGAGYVTNGSARTLTSTGSLANVASDTTGLIYYQDRANNLVWMQVKLYTLIQAAIAHNYILGSWKDIEYQRSTIAITV